MDDFVWRVGKEYGWMQKVMRSWEFWNGCVYNVRYTCERAGFASGMPGLLVLCGWVGRSARAQLIIAEHTKTAVKKMDGEEKEEA